MTRAFEVDVVTMMPADQSSGYPTTTAQLPGWVTRLAIQSLVTSLLLGSTAFVALESRHLVEICLGSVFIVFACWVITAASRGLRIAGWMAVATSTATLLAVFGFLSLGPQQDELPRIGDEMVRQIEEYRRGQGTYPESLHAAGIRTNWTRFGSWYYEARDHGSWYSLGIGNRAADGFTLQRTSLSSEWAIVR